MLWGLIYNLNISTVEKTFHVKIIYNRDYKEEI
jgi:hypothetical protein